MSFGPGSLMGPEAECGGQENDENLEQPNRCGLQAVRMVQDGLDFPPS